MEDELDKILSQVGPEQLHALELEVDDPHLLHNGPGPSSSRACTCLPEQKQPLPLSSSTRFNSLKSDSELEEAKKKAIPKNTDKNTSWALKIWKEWSAHRRQTCQAYKDWPTHLLVSEPSQLDYWMSKFVLEVRKQNGQQYPPDSLYGICSGLLRYIRETRPHINIFKDPQFAGFQRTLDSEMKRLRTVGMGVKKRQAEPITIDEENLLWEKGFLGDTSPQVLLDTLLFLCGIQFALRSGEEHRSLQISQFELVLPREGKPHLIYRENFSKNNLGGLQHRKVKPKTVACYPNEQNPQRCLVRLYQTYLQHRPTDVQHFYLTPLRKPKTEVWYSKVPVGHNTLARTVSRLCEVAGIEGYKTNHSLRVTSATRLFQNGVDEQLIMSHTGHRSVDGVRSYKRVSEEQKMTVSSMLNSQTVSVSQSSDSDLDTAITKKQKLDTHHQSQAVSLSLTNTESSSTCVPSFTFNGCTTSITINYNN